MNILELEKNILNSLKKEVIEQIPDDLDRYLYDVLEYYDSSKSDLVSSFNMSSIIDNNNFDYSYEFKYEIVFNYQGYKALGIIKYFQYDTCSYSLREANEEDYTPKEYLINEINNICFDKFEVLKEQKIK